ncbi:Rho guanine nucleotide exchange factor 37 [Leucoagaricus sp. SymC.cos]|nr:Rho guanine nucleotide exchange factor 37 [Leucoagaricus sp. SymC.cos]
MNGLPQDLPTPPLSVPTDRAQPHHSPDQSRPPTPKLVPGPSSALDLLSPLPLTPVTPNTTLSSDSKPKKSNPLNDLIDTEKQYVDQLTGVIRKVAAAWSRTNLPPPDLDTMFRSIEGVYRANRSLYSKLKEIGTNPSSPKALGDLLMRWIDDLRAPYTTYCTKYCSGFDTWEPVQSNPKLPGALATFSAACPPPASAENPSWTLDGLFLLPKTRLKYYKKLYSRLLKTTEPGRSDYRLLVGALDTLEFLLGVVESRSTIQPGDPAEISHPTATEQEDQVVIDTRPQESPPVLPPFLSAANSQPASESDAGSQPGDSVSDGQRSSQETTATTVSRGSTSTLSMPLSELERRLKTDRTLDIFTMKPKAVTLHMNPPQLTFTRELRFSGDVVVRFVPRNSTEEIVHRQGHIFLLSDLFLVCKRMSPEEQAQHAGQGADMWLCYPPLAGKVLRVVDLEGRDNAVQVAIMRKEFLTLEFPSAVLRNTLTKQLKDRVPSTELDFTLLVPPPSKGPPPPVPPINPMFLNHTEPPVSNSNSPTSRVSSPHSSDVHGVTTPPSIRSPPPDAKFVDHMNRLRLDDHSPIGRPLPSGATSSLPPGPPVPNNLRPSASAQAFSSHPPPFGPGHVPPPARSSGQHSGQHSGQYGLPPGPQPPRPPSEPQMQHQTPGIRKTPSTRSLTSQYSQFDQPLHAPPVPSIPGGLGPTMSRNSSFSTLSAPQPRPLLPSANARGPPMAETSFDAPSPPGSPVPETPQVAVPLASTISAQLKCKLFLQQQHAQWKSLGSGKLKLYCQDVTNIKQLVVEADDKNKTILVSTIVLTDGVERVGKTGVAIELSDKGARTGIIYMIQLRNEKAAGGLFDSLLAGSDRSR